MDLHWRFLFDVAPCLRVVQELVAVRNRLDVMLAVDRSSRRWLQVMADLSVDIHHGDGLAGSCCSCIESLQGDDAWYS